MTTRKKTTSKRNISDLVQLFREIYEIVKEYSDDIMKFSRVQYRKLKLRYSGKSIAIIGPKAAGKTTFLNILQNPNIEVDTMVYTPTQGSNEIESFQIKYKVPMSDPNGHNNEIINFKMKKPKDVGGEKSYRESGDWESVCRGTDFIFYLFDSYEFSNNNKMKARVFEDIQWIADNNQIFNQNFGIVMFANKIDKIPEKDIWINENVSELEIETIKILDDFKNHLKLISPISLQSKSTRTNTIGRALLKVAELEDK